MTKFWMVVAFTLYRVDLDLDLVFLIHVRTTVEF